jgi:Xaa-Pro aminopeptidase
LDVHDKIPLLDSRIEYELKQGMIVTVEPGLYIPNLGGARTEDLILVTKDGYEKLSHAPIKWY